MEATRDRIDDGVQAVELTVLMPCLNEVAHAGGVHRQGAGYFRRAGVAGEVLIADNGSTDGSVELAQAPRRARGARAAARLRGGADRRHPPPRAGASSSWATPTTATTSRACRPSSTPCAAVASW
jgi:hypothetical protein